MLWWLKKVWYHIFQFFFNIACYFLPWRQPELLTGAGSVKRLPALIKSKGVSRVLIVTDAVLRKLGLLDAMLQAMDAEGIAYTIFDGVQPNPSIENIEDARKIYLDNSCEAIVAFGGGSSMDCAKACGARVVKPRQSVEQMGGLLKILKRIPLLFAVPTTAGTGSETTLAAVVTNRATHHKYAINDLALIPRYAALDPELTVGLPPHITSTTGMDALTHAVEAFTNRHAPRYTDRFAIDAVKLIFDNLETAYNDPSNIAARDNMLHASFKAGAAFTRACVGYVHAIAHTLGGFYGTPHGLANAVILPHIMHEFGKSAEERLARLAEAVGISGATDHDKAQAFIAEIRAMNERMKIPSSFDFIKDEDIPTMIEYALAEANPVYPVPEIWDAARMREAIDGIRS